MTAASPDAVWQVLADLPGWPDIIPGVTRVDLAPGTLPTPGLDFAWRNSGTPLRSTVQRATPGRELTWTGTAMWLVAIHQNTLEALPGGGTRLTSRESMSGFGATQLMSPAKLQAALQALVDAVTAEAERRQDT